MELTRDAFLGGRVHVWQPRAGYRAGVDAVLLAAACAPAPGDAVLELGCGVGTVLACLATRMPDLDLTGVERQTEMADLARRNLAENAMQARIIAADIADLSADVRAVSFDHILMNPPYFDRGAGTASPLSAREAAMGEQTPLAIWVDVATRRLSPRGTLTAILTASRLPELLAACDKRLGSLVVRPVQPRTGRGAQLVILQARKGGRAQFRLLAPLVMHDGARHERDGDDYSAEASAILRNAAAIGWPR